MTVAGKENVRPGQQAADAAAAAALPGGDGAADRCALSAAAAPASGAPLVGAEEGQEMNFLPPNMPGFSELDLQFICAFTEVGGRGCLLLLGAAWCLQGCSWGRRNCIGSCGSACSVPAPAGAPSPA